MCSCPKGIKGSIGFPGYSDGRSLPDYMIKIIDFRNKKYWESLKATRTVEEDYKVDKEYDNIDEAIHTMINNYVP